MESHMSGPRERSCGGCMASRSPRECDGASPAQPQATWPSGAGMARLTMLGCDARADHDSALPAAWLNSASWMTENLILSNILNRHTRGRELYRVPHFDHRCRGSERARSHAVAAAVSANPGLLTVETQTNLQEVGPRLEEMRGRQMEVKYISDFRGSAADLPPKNSKEFFFFFCQDIKARQMRWRESSDVDNSYSITLSVKSDVRNSDAFPSN